jgi:hypothetical protein
MVGVGRFVDGCSLGLGSGWRCMSLGLWLSAGHDTSE